MAEDTVEALPLKNNRNTALLLIRGQNFFFWASYCVVLSYLPLYFHEKGLSAQEIGVVLATGSAITIIGQPFWGIMADRFGSIRRTILLLTAFSTILCFSLYMVDSFFSILILMALLMFFFASIMPLNDSMNLKASDALQVTYSAIRGWGSLGFAAASIGIGYLLLLLGLSQLVYVFLAFMALTFFCLYRSTESGALGNRLQMKDLVLLLQNSRFLFFLIFVLIISIPHQLNLNLLTIHLSMLGASDQVIGLAWMTATGMEGLVFLLFGRLVEKYNPLPVLVVSSFLFSLRWLLYSVISSPELIATLQLMQACTFTLFLSASIRYMAKIIPQNLRATGQGVFAAVFLGVAGTIGNIAGGWGIQEFGGATVYGWAGLLTAFGGIYIFTYMLYGANEKRYLFHISKKG